jgi:flagellar basal body-associated protein FliL
LVAMSDRKSMRQASGLKQKFMTAIQIVVLVVLLLVLLEIGLIIFFKMMEYHASVARSLNVTPNLIGTAVRVLIIIPILFNS